MKQFLTEEFFSEAIEVLSKFYPTQVAIRAFGKKASFQPEDYDLQGTGKEMISSLLSLAEKEEKVLLLIETALSPADFPDDDQLKKLQKALKDGSAYLPVVTMTGLSQPVAGQPVKVMMVYDVKDQKMAGELLLHLNPYVNFLRSITVFDMHTSPEVIGGVNAKAIIDSKLEESQIILLLLTPNFLGSPGNDCARLAFNAFQMGKRVIPVLLEACIWDRISMLENIVPLPKNKEFVSRWRNKDEAFLEIATGVDQVATALKKKTN